MHATANLSMPEPRAQQPRSLLFWGMLGAVVAVQLFAFWLLCNQQVRNAQARQNEWTAQQTALADCLQYVPGSTIASCSSRKWAQARVPQATAQAGGVTQVSFSR